MKTLIEMPPENYDLLLSKLYKDSHAFAVLKNGLVVNNSGVEI